MAGEQGLLYHIRSVKHAAVSASWTRHWLTMARGTMPARSSCASRISVSTSCVALRLAGYSTCQAIQRLPSGSGKFSIFKSTWSTRRKPISNLPEHKGSGIEGVNDAVNVCERASLWQQSIKGSQMCFFFAATCEFFSTESHVSGSFFASGGRTFTLKTRASIPLLECHSTRTLRPSLNCPLTAAMGKLLQKHFYLKCFQ